MNNISISLNNAIRQKDSLRDLERRLRFLRVQLGGEFPAEVGDKTVAAVSDSVCSAFERVQTDADIILSVIDTHLSAISDLVGYEYYPGNEDDEGGAIPSPRNLVKG